MHTTILKTEAIALKIREYSNTSHRVCWVSPEYGRFSTLVKGACRPKSAFLGQYDLFYTCELLFYARNREGVHIARECAPLVRRDGLRRDWRSIVCASYLCDLVERVSPSGTMARNLYAPVAEALDALADGAGALETALRFEVRLLSALGFAPDVTGCPQCLAQESGEVRFAIAEGKVVCDVCSPRRDGAQMALPQKVATALREMSAGGAGLQPGTRLCSEFSTEDWLRLRRFLGMFLRYHLEDELQGRSWLEGL